MDLTGQVFGRLTVVGPLEMTVSGRFWEVRCSCGNVRRVRTVTLRNGKQKSCGCLRMEHLRKRHTACQVQVVDGKKKCSKCKRLAPVADFAKSKKTLSGLNSHCTSCQLTYHRRRRFGLTAEDAAAILQMQGGTCGACARTVDLQLDHDHVTDCVRGFLCGPCTRALGLLQDDLDTIARLWHYLRERTDGTQSVSDAGRSNAAT